MKDELWPLERIKPYPNNPRTHPDEQIKLLAELMKNYGPDQRIVVDEAGVIIKGHGRLEAAILAELEQYPVTIRTGLTKNQKDEMRIADNQVALLSNWNMPLLRAEASRLKMAGSDLRLLCFDQITLNWIGAGEAVNDAQSQWAGMPEFHQEDATAFRSIVVHFKDQKAVDDFAAVTKQNITEKTRFLWYPNIEIKPFVKVKSK